MTGSNPLIDLRLIVKDLINSVGSDKIYDYRNDRYPDAPPFKHLNEEVLIEELISRISRRYGQELEIIIIEEDPGIKEKSIYGMFTFFPEYHSLYIVVDSNMNYCWKKFAVVKELCHLYINFDDELGANIQVSKEDNYLVSLKDVFEETEIFKNFDYTSYEEIDDKAEERDIVLLAIELMLPIYDRDQLMEMVSKVGDNQSNLTVHSIAKSLLMPEYILQNYIKLNAINCDPKYSEI